MIIPPKDESEEGLNDFARRVCEVALALPPALRGRQNDIGADLSPAGVLILPLARDRLLPGVYSADLLELRRGRQAWHRVLTIRDGAAGSTANVQPLAGDAALITQLLTGHLAPGVFRAVTGGSDPLQALSDLIAQRRAQGGGDPR